MTEEATRTPRPGPSGPSGSDPAASPRSGSGGRPTEPRRPGLRCDFCGEIAPSVRRVALDRDYDRLQTPHRELYACDPCSERKEKRRLGL